MNKDLRQKSNSNISHTSNPDHTSETPLPDIQTQNYWQSKQVFYDAPFASNPYESPNALQPPASNTAVLKNRTRSKFLFVTIGIALLLIIGSVTYISLQGVQSIAHTSSSPVKKSAVQLPTNTTFQSLPGTWTLCAVEAATCSFSGTMTVAFGANGKFNYATASTSIVCSSASFGGDPIENRHKACYIEPVPLATNVWSQCAEETATCSLEGTMTVAFGANGEFDYTTASTSTFCTNAAFGSDPSVNTAKACYVIAPPATTVTWRGCAAENGTCSFSGTHEVAYGTNGQYSYGTFTNQTPCNDSVFGRSAYNSGKSCYYQ